MSRPLESLLATPDLDALVAELAQLSATERRELADAVDEAELSFGYFASDGLHGRAFVPYEGAERERRLRLQLVFLAGMKLNEPPGAHHRLRFLRRHEPGLVGRVWALREKRWRVAAWRLLRFQDRRVLLKAEAPDCVQDDEYFLQMFDLNESSFDGGLYEKINADPEILEEDVWSLFRCVGDSRRSFANHDKYAKGAGTWNEVLRRLAAEGKLSRSRLLRESLESLGRDFPAYRAGWFARFHEDLKPSDDERAELSTLYLHLLHSNIRATVTFAIDALKRLHEAQKIDPRELLDGLEPAVRVETKGAARKVLAVLESLGHIEDLRARAARLSEAMWTHPDAEIQAGAIALSKSLAAETVIPETVIELLAPSVRLQEVGRHEASTPSDMRPPGRVELDLPPIDWTRMPASPASASIAPIDDVEELFDRARAMAEGQIDVLDWERVVDSFARLHTELASPENREALDTLRKRCRDLDRRFRAKVGAGLLPAQWLLQFLDPEALPPLTDSSHVRKQILVYEGRISRRIDAPRMSAQDHILAQGGDRYIWMAAMEDAARCWRAGRPRPSLSLPTHRSFRIEPAALEARLHEARQAGHEIGPADLQLARLRTGESVPAGGFDFDQDWNWRLDEPAFSAFGYQRLASIVPQDLETYARCCIRELRWNHGFHTAVWGQKHALQPELFTRSR